MTRRDKACLVSIHRFFFLAEFETETRRALSLPMTNAFYGMTLNSITVMVE
jgi:hypothetical protein